ncbi:hypothetical protein FHR99_003156 [Litorivivens lipolytica]|uniref:Uncharacterized protein n=1 Tax=Litorivivens lipolytica TaxID=1524264 RepID=A0A7W4W8Q4_9GAMM|nr:hypothetical protein [Litorivivens lipolytica]MBB3048882.1 hypothetical protein [Litorivivens lipolytica]
MLTQVKELIDKGYSLTEIAQALDRYLDKEFNFEKAGESNDYDSSGNYCPPLEVLLPALSICSDIEQIKLALIEFNLYWKESRQGRVIYPHRLFIEFLEKRDFSF